MKKYFALMSVFALAFALAMPIAFADDRRDGRDSRGAGFEVSVENDAEIVNEAWSMANTGGNDAHGNTSRGRIVTGVATTDALADTKANNTDLIVDAPRHNRSGFEVEVENDAEVDNLAVSLANTGMNDANHNGSMSRCGRCARTTGGTGSVTTGNAASISTAMTMVNNNVVRVR